MYEQYELIASTTETVSGEKDAVLVNESGVLNPSFQQPLTPGARAYLCVSAASGTKPTLEVSIVKTINSIDYVVGVFRSFDEPGTEVIEIRSCPDLVKAVYIIDANSSPSFTFEVHMTR